MPTFVPTVHHGEVDHGGALNSYRKRKSVEKEGKWRKEEKWKGEEERGKKEEETWKRGRERKKERSRERGGGMKDLAVNKQRQDTIAAVTCL